MSTGQVRQLKKFTNHQVETAIMVAMESRSVRNWVEGQARFLNINPGSPEGKDFFERESRAAAKRLLDVD